MTTDTGARLRALHDAAGGVGAIFSAKVADYVASRPGYPAALFAHLRAEGHLSPSVVVADVGAGTGLLTHGLLAEGCSVIAIEPSAAMRAAADVSFARLPNYRSASGTAESMPLPTPSVDLITAAQAFHWFEIEAARAEFLRVLRPQGTVALIWNDRVLADLVHIALDELFARHGGAKRAALVAHEDRNQVATFFGATVPIERTWPHQHHLDEAGLASLVFSRSYMPERDSAPGRMVHQQVQELFDRFVVGGRIAVRYTTVALVGRPGIETPGS